MEKRMNVVQQNNIDSILKENVSIVLPEYSDLHTDWFLILHNSITKKTRLFDAVIPTSLGKVCTMFNGDTENVIHRFDIVISNTNKKDKKII
jgi:hypothetical protein